MGAGQKKGLTEMTGDRRGGKAIQRHGDNRVEERMGVIMGEGRKVNRPPGGEEKRKRW